MIVRNLEKLKRIIDAQKKQGKRVIIKGGVFDLVHPGHIFMLNELKEHAEFVVIVLMHDEKVKQKKKKSPIVRHEDRAIVVDGLKNVDVVFLDENFSEVSTENTTKRYINLLDTLSPDLVAITKTTDVNTAAYQGHEWKVVELDDKSLKGYSTSQICNKIIDMNSQSQ